MARKRSDPKCALCGARLGEQDWDRGTCHACRSPKGKVLELDIAIRASGDSPERIREWPEIRHLLRDRFGMTLSDEQLWQRCTDWLRAEVGLEPKQYLSLTLGEFRELLKSKARPSRIEVDSIRRKKKGKKADYRKTVRENELAKKWGKARECGEYKPDFARENGYNLADFQRLLNRVAKRESRSDK